MAAAAATSRAGRASASSATLRSLQRCDTVIAAAAPAVAGPSRRLASTTANAASVASPETTSQHILSAVQRYDYPNYLCALAVLLPEPNSIILISLPSGAPPSTPPRKRDTTILPSEHSMSRFPTSQTRSRTSSLEKSGSSGGEKRYSR